MKVEIQVDSRPAMTSLETLNRCTTCKHRTYFFYGTSTLCPRCKEGDSYEPEVH